MEEKVSYDISPEDWDKYSAMAETHRVKLNEIAQQAHPGEWSYGLDFVVEFLKFMRDFYKLGIGVFGMELCDEDPKRHKNTPTRLTTLEKTLYYYERWVRLEDEYIKIVPDGEFKDHDNGDGTFIIDNLGYHCEYKYGPRNNPRRAMKITYRKLYKRQQKYKKLFFKMLYKYMESWWD